MRTIGDQLRTARLRKRWTPEDAAKVTKMRADRLLEIEANNFSKVEPAYVRHFVRLYARALGLEERKMMAQLDGLITAPDDVEFVPIPAVEYVPEASKSGLPVEPQAVGFRLIVGVALAFVGVAGFILYPTLQAWHPGVAANPVQAPIDNYSPSNAPVAPTARDSVGPIAVPATPVVPYGPPAPVMMGPSRPGVPPVAVAATPAAPAEVKAPEIQKPPVTMTDRGVVKVVRAAEPVTPLPRTVPVTPRTVPPPPHSR